VFNGIRLVISIVPTRAEEKIAAMGIVSGFDYSSAKIFYRPSVITLTSKTAGRKGIAFGW